MKQQTLVVAADQGAGYEQHRKPTRRDEFLATMNKIVPWAELCAVVESHYLKAGNGRAPIGLVRMLRIHFIQHWSTSLTWRVRRCCTFLVGGELENPHLRQACALEGEQDPEVVPSAMGLEKWIVGCIRGPNLHPKPIRSKSVKPKGRIASGPIDSMREGGPGGWFRHKPPFWRFRLCT